MSDNTDPAQLLAIEMVLERLPLIMLWRWDDAEADCGGPDNCGRQAEWTLAVAVEAEDPANPVELGETALCSMCVGVLIVSTVDGKLLAQDE